MRGDRLGPLHGVPIALKDEVWTEGIPSTGGSLLFARWTPRRDGTVAERLRAAGAIIVGKTQLPEFAAWPRSKSRLAAESVNPWDPSRISGASSGGSAAAVSAGLVPVAIGSDGGGSIRIPSALCGTVGLYPTPGRVSSYGSFSYNIAGSLGPMARSVRDVAIVQRVIAGPDARDASARTDEPPDVVGGLDAGVAGLRIAWSPDQGRIDVQPGVAAAVASAMRELAELGATVEQIDATIGHPWGDAAPTAAFQADVASSADDVATTELELPDMTAEEDWMWATFDHVVPLTATERFRELCRRSPHLLAPHTRLRIAGATIFSLDDESRQRRLTREVHDLLDRFDVVCSPTMRTVAPPIPDGWASPYDNPFMGTDFTFVANTAGCPAASMPCGLVDGLPVGLQVIGRPGDEATVLRACRAFEHATRDAPWAVMRPRMAGDATGSL